jgi:hypothetical protein
MSSQRLSCTVNKTALTHNRNIANEDRSFRGVLHVKLLVLSSKSFMIRMMSYKVLDIAGHIPIPIVIKVHLPKRLHFFFLFDFFVLDSYSIFGYQFDESYSL